MIESPRHFYVYEHRRLSDGVVFYIGKGAGDRAFSPASRNRKWRFTADKHGWASEIVRANMHEACAFTLERCLISLYGASQLSNMTTGGEGRAGSVSGRRKTVYCSNGMVFHSTIEAGKWLVSIGHGKASGKSITAAITGKKDVVYGLRWSTKGTPDLSPVLSANPKMVCGQYHKIAVRCSNGDEFDSASDASEFAFGHRKGYAKILACCDGTRKTAGGYTWVRLEKI